MVGRSGRCLVVGHRRDDFAKHSVCRSRHDKYAEDSEISFRGGVDEMGLYGEVSASNKMLTRMVEVELL